MVKFTDSFFSFPIKVYDRMSVSKALKVDHLLGKGDDEVQEPDWVMGIRKMPVQWFLDDKVSYCEGYSDGRSIEDVEKEGMDLTLVLLDDMTYVCLWPMRKFEEKLNEFMNRLEEEKEGE